jgi:peptidoglycan/LPS O-acetylase OafA/YrhL
MIESNKNRIDYLDGFRGIAILLVIIGHGSRLISETNEWKNLFLFVGNEHLGVEIFFVLSGFLITKLLINENEKYGFIKIKKFFLKRIIRIFPVFYLYIGIVFILSCLGFLVIKKSTFIIACIYLFNYRSFFPISINVDEWYLAHLWSLSVEEQFYLIWPSLILIFTMKRMVKVAVVLLLLFPFFRLANYILLPDARGLMVYMMHTAGDCIIYGCLGALLLSYYPVRVERFLNVIDRYKVYIIISVYLFFISPILHHAWLPTKSGFITPTLNPLCIIVLMLWLLQTQKCWSFFNNSYLMQLGVYSYSIYIWQQLFLTPLNTTFTGIFPINYVATGIAAWLSYNFVEKQFLKLKSKI